MKRNAVLRIVLYALAIVLLVALLLAGLGLNAYLFVPTSETTGSGNLIAVDSFDPEKISCLKIDWAAGSINVLSSDTANKITISETNVSSDSHKMDYHLSGDTLEIDFSKSKVYVGVQFDQAKDLFIEVPASWICDELEIDTASAYVKLQDMVIRKVDFDGASGQFDMVNCDLGSLDLDTASGDVLFHGTLDHLDCDAASASCQITVTNIPRTIELDSASGDLDLALPEDCGFTCKMDTMSGEFRSDFETTHRNSVYTHGDGHCDIQVSAMSGSVVIRKYDKGPATDPVTGCMDPNCSDPHCTTHGCKDTVCTDPNCATHGCTDENCSDPDCSVHGCTDFNCTDSSHGHKTTHH